MNKSRYTLIIGFNKYEGFKAFLDNGDTETVTPRIEEPFKTKKETHPHTYK